MNRQNARLLVIILAVFVVSALGSYLFFGRPAPRTAVETTTDATPQPSAMTQASEDSSRKEQSQGARKNEPPSFFTEIFGPGAAADPSHTESWKTVVLRVMVRLSLAALLASMLAFRPRRFAMLFKRNLFVAQTQILLC